MLMLSDQGKDCSGDLLCFLASQHIFHTLHSRDLLHCGTHIPKVVTRNSPQGHIPLIQRRWVCTIKTREIDSDECQRGYSAVRHIRGHGPTCYIPYLCQQCKLCTMEVEGVVGNLGYCRIFPMDLLAFSFALLLSIVKIQQKGSCF